MRFSQYSILTLSSLALLSNAVPYMPKGEGLLQQNRRRAVDYPVTSKSTRALAHPNQKRSIPSYSVVQVDGSANAIPTITQTTTPTPSLMATPEIIYITTTQDHLQTVTASAMPIIITPTPSAQLEFTTQLATNTIVAPLAEPETQTLLVTVAPSPTSTAFYDDGLWHTYYPIKSFTTRAAGVAASSGRAIKRGLDARVPKEIEVASWNVTRTELVGMDRYRSR